MDKQPEATQTIIFDDMVLEKIAGKTASEVDGVLSLQGSLIDNLSDRLTESDRPQSGVDIELDDQQKTVAIELDAILEYGKRAEEILTKVTSKITSAVTTMTGYRVTEVKLRVKDMLTKDEWQQRQQSSRSKKKKDD
ncbi:Asp23/Gls24 family envelope stress response protein [Levilactobacillus brevis]|uniref:Asp23/Gls24 family envelope stress response protein n=1 Tax=Levilactobacillus brevis TaxID=1580 RepID=UPI000A20C019|nr:Asp23/Gls24 family envelope stress response protein [Levilactobacillus brevis]ARN89399.1 alkaline-shock protein [Levilactobacillus brevis]ARN96977.1 alkaline-shock protein [Levilactobacillus brevis]MDA0409901.1 Asp23/Gls24 family envelope stress response protein [Levilactobacillus brevis]